MVTRGLVCIHGSNTMDTPWIRVYPCVTMDTRDAVDTPWIQMYPRVSMDTFSDKYTKVYPWIRVDTYVSMVVWIQIGIHRAGPLDQTPGPRHKAPRKPCARY